MFRGIDPAGLDTLATTLDRQTSTLRHQAHITLDMLRRHGRNGDADSVGSTVGQIENWSLDTTNTLRWRTQTIRSGQGAGWDVFRVARARFAAEAVFSLDTVDETYQRWVEAPGERTAGCGSYHQHLRLASPRMDRLGCHQRRSPQHLAGSRRIVRRGARPCHRCPLPAPAGAVDRGDGKLHQRLLQG